ncbi:hypothetical protein [Rhodanobacter ginsengiterrae]|uniref:hypothetical protein n=1 Tax=Rhodanobacter ginsengiterrae TaxID=2008451 RepID=UPI003CED6F4F
MKTLIVKRAKVAWKDPVWSKVISAAIIGTALGIWKAVSSASFSKAVGFIASPIVLPAWLLLLLVASAAFGFWHIRPRRKPKPALTPTKSLVHGIADASSLVASWWPKATGYFPDDVHVDYAALENQFSLAPGVTQQAVSNVASQNCFKIKIPGTLFATFEYDHQKAHHG